MKLLGHFSGHKTELQWERPFSNLKALVSVEIFSFMKIGTNETCGYTFPLSATICYIKILQTTCQKKLPYLCCLSLYSAISYISEWFHRDPFGCLNVNQTQKWSRFSAIPIRIPKAFFCRNRKSNLKIHMEPQKTLSSWSGFETEEQSWGHHTSGFQTASQSCSDDTGCLTRKARTRNKHACIWAVHLPQRCEAALGMTVSSGVALGELDGRVQQNETGFLGYTTHKRQLKMN